MQKLEEAVKYIRGVEAQVRPHARRNEWYGEEVNAKPTLIDLEP